jgi:hypothetical protein
MCTLSSATTIRHLTLRASGRPSSAVTSSQVVCVGVGTLRIASDGAGRAPGGRERLGLLDVRRVVGLRAPRDRVLARVRQHLELVRREAADRAGVRLDGAELEPQPREDARVRVVHRAVACISASRSTSNEYASFIRNSRPRITPKRGRISSRNLTWIW